MRLWVRCPEKPLTPNYLWEIKVKKNAKHVDPMNVNKKMYLGVSLLRSGDGEMAQQLRAVAAFAQDPGSVPT